MTRRTKLVSLALAICLLAFINPPHPLDVIKIETGLVSGTVNEAGDIHIYRGIPFAAPPVGDLGWKEPQPVKPLARRSEM